MEGNMSGNINRAIVARPTSRQPLIPSVIEDLRRRGVQPESNS
ncbi:hypothetical protein SEA_HUTC2_74 [Mycobacterium phage Hutc2]|nr:hypothetical protein SEA_HUTC2_74 [Mycobacterium phage Hutc2]